MLLENTERSPSTAISRRSLAWAALPLLALLAIYLPDLGHGFLKDDFAWLGASRASTPREVAAVFSQDNGFYRPLVSLSFTLNQWLCGLQPRGHALVNLGLLLGSGIALWSLARALAIPEAPALFAAATWALNPHGIPMALLWISGRTVLLLSLFSLLAARCFVQRKYRLAALGVFAATLCREEAVLLPLILLCWAGFDEPKPGWRLGVAVRRCWPSFAAAGVYLVLRSRTAAYLPHTAPPFYRPSLDPLLLARNVLEYADRSCSFGAALLLIWWLVVRKRPRLLPLERRWVLFGTAWLVGGSALAVFLPLRSSLYACFPSLGFALIVGALACALWRETPAAARRALPLLAAAIPFLLLPVYRMRAVRWVRPAELSASVLSELARDPAPAGVVTVVHDAQGARHNLAAAFGSLLQEAVRLHTGDAAARVWLEPPAPNWEAAGLQPPRPDEAVRHFILRDGRLVAWDKAEL